MEAKTRKLKVLYVVTEDWYFCSHRLNLARAAQKRGFEIHVATRAHSQGHKILTEGFNLHPLTQLRRTNLTPWYDMRAIFELWKVYHKVRPDIVHQVALKPVLYGTLIARFTRVPKIINALGGVGSLFISKNPRMKWLQKGVIFLLKHLLNHETQTLIVQNSEDYKLWQRKAKLSPAQLILIRGSGVDIDRFKPRQYKINQIPIVVCAARILWDKGIGELAESARILKQRRLQFRLMLYGSIDDQNPSAIDQPTLINWQKEGLLEWLGHSNDIAAVYQAADIAVLPSYREGLPKTLLEAAACQLPIVTTDVPGCRDIVLHKVNGLLVPAQNPQLLADALEVLIKDKNLRQLYGKAARRRAEREFADKLIIDQIFKLYDQSGPL